MQSGFAIDYVLPLLAETVIALAVLLVGVLALHNRHRWAVWPVVAGAVWASVQVIYVAHHLTVEAGSTGLSDLLYDWHLIAPLRWLRLAAIALIVPTLWLAALPATKRASSSGDRLREPSGR